MVTYTTRDGDRLDQICLNVYGKTGKTTEEVLYLVANYGIVDMCAVFPAGQVIELPDISAEPVVEETQLWD
ncbi:tail protein X [Leclercia adecarboxylata]|uniref:tail protein X n=1 Tax=Leclercia adecarboxylata TaxID=83655 RepID=UPI002DB6BDE1|nr:tail protein X [Leclercia adecarboxylata]MEB5748650.1 tail protein X [Leclercia adecarboxylata]